MKNEFLTLQTALCYASFKLSADENKKTAPFSENDTPFSVMAGKNDTADFSLLLSCDCDALIQLDTAPCFSQTIGTPTVRVAAVSDLPVALHHVELHQINDGTYRADALSHTTVTALPAGTAGQIYVSVGVPAGTQTGAHPLTLRFFFTRNCADEELLGEITVTVRVTGYTFPDKKDTGFMLDLWQHPSNIARKHEVALWSDAHFAVLENYCRLLGEMGVGCVTVIASEIPWNGQWCHTMPQPANLYEYSMIGVTKHADGSFSYDYSVMQRYIDLCAKYGIDEIINVFGLVNVWNASFLDGKTVSDYPDCMHIRYFDEASGLYRYMRLGAEVDGYIRSLETYFIETNQIDRVRISADEPHVLEPFKESLDRLHANAPRFRCKTACDKPEFVDAFGDIMDDFVYDIETVSGKYDKIQRVIAAHPEKRFLYYTCCQPDYPNNFLKSALCETYFQCMYASFLHVSGFLRWDFTVWGDDPRHNLILGKWDAGDSFFVYPANDGTPMDSLRLRALKRGIRFFVLLQDAKKRGETALFARAIDAVLYEHDQAKLITNENKTDSFSCKTDDYERVWEMLLTALQA